MLVKNRSNTYIRIHASAAACSFCMFPSAALRCNRNHFEATVKKNCWRLCVCVCRGKDLLPHVETCCRSNQPVHWAIYATVLMLYIFMLECTWLGFQPRQAWHRLLNCGESSCVSIRWLFYNVFMWIPALNGLNASWAGIKAVTTTLWILRVKRNFPRSYAAEAESWTLFWLVSGDLTVCRQNSFEFLPTYATEGWRDESCYMQTDGTDSRPGGNLNTGFVWRDEEKWAETADGVCLNYSRDVADLQKSFKGPVQCFYVSHHLSEATL